MKARKRDAGGTKDKGNMEIAWINGKNESKWRSGL